MQIVAQNWLVYSLTKSPFYLGLDAFLQQLPIILFSLIGGVFADRYDRRRTLLLSQIVQMSTSAALALLMYFQAVQIWQILALSFVTGCAQAFGGPAYQSLIPSLVDKKDLPNAVALNSIQFNVARVLGPLAFGVILGAFQRYGYSEPQAMNACFAAQLAVVPGRHQHADDAAREAHPAGDLGKNAGRAQDRTVVRPASLQPCRARSCSRRRQPSSVSRC